MEYNHLDKLSRMWMSHKNAEKLAAEKRRKIEDEMLGLLGIPETFEGVQKSGNNFEIKVTGRMVRKTDTEKLRVLAEENNLTDHAAHLFRWKADINMAVWKKTNSKITDIFLDAITTKPSRASFSITNKGE